MAVETRCELTFVVAMCAESLLEELFGQYTCFRKSINAHLNFEMYIIVVENVVQVAFFDNLIQEDIYLHLHVPWLGQKYFEVEFF